MGVCLGSNQGKKKSKISNEVALSAIQDEFRTLSFPECFCIIIKVNFEENIEFMETYYIIEDS